MAEPLDLTVGWCFVCERGGVVLTEVRQRPSGRLVLACADEHACCEAYARKPRIRHRRRIERGSLGTPEAQAARASVSAEEVARVLALAKELEKGTRRRGRADG